MNDQLSPLESLQLIQSMVAKTRSNLGENRFYFLLWGWVAFLSFLLQFLLKTAAHYPHHYLVWLSTIPAALITIWYGRKRHRHAPRTYVGESMSYLWMGMGISFFVLIVILYATKGWLHAYPLFILMYGLGTFVSGKILQFKPLVFGGIFNWALAALCAFLPYDYQLLMAALALLTSYIIPGYLLKQKNQ